ncbi:RepA leader peptide Tap [Escherichia coli]|nr:RepA leader peptide Tap [Escherichia coli]
MDLQEPEKAKTPIIFLCLATKKITGANKKPYSQQFSYAGSIVICPEKVQDFFLCSLLLRIVSAGWCD